MKAFGTVLLVLGLVIVAPYLIGPVHMFVGGPRPPDNVSWAPVSLGVALIGIGAIVLAVRPGAKRNEEQDKDEDRVPCAFCAEHIRPEAILCPHCGSIVATPAGRLAQRGRRPTIRDQKNALTACILCLHEAVQRALTYAFGLPSGTEAILWLETPGLPTTGAPDVVNPKCSRQPHYEKLLAVNASLTLVFTRHE